MKLLLFILLLGPVATVSAEFPAVMAESNLEKRSAVIGDGRSV